MSLFAGVVLSGLLAKSVAAADHPDFDDYRKGGSVIQPYSRSQEAGTYGVTLRMNNGNVRALGDGQIYSAGRMRGYGRYVIIDHGGGWHSLYSNLARIDVHAGQRISRGATIGSAKHKRLFLVVSYRGNPINPSDVMGPRVIARNFMHYGTQVVG